MNLHELRDQLDHQENLSALATDEWLIRQRRRKLRDFLGLMLVAVVVLIVVVFRIGE